MHIKSVVLDGFKSYGQRIEISGFDPLFTAITGLNGSGKSNILDAICFVLGISNLAQLRANSLQDLIFKSGQAGVNRAIVSITFDNRNRNQCPPGYENIEEITITRQIALGGKDKYMINGTNVPNNRIHDLFCSVQMNVNNPHFLIMQGRITKVLNMKPLEILSMIEEAAGARMYEVKRQATQKLMEKKDSKLKEFTSVIKEELSPKLEKLRAEREQYLEYQRIERELEYLLQIFHAWQYIEAKKQCVETEKALHDGQQNITNMQEKIEQNKQNIAQLEEEIENFSSSNSSETTKELEEYESRLKGVEKEEAQIKANAKSAKDNIAVEEKKILQLKKKIANEEEILKTRQNDLNQAVSVFEELKENDRRDNEALQIAEKKYEALCAGMEVNDQGETETLAEQLMHAKEEASRAGTESKQAAIELKYCQDELRNKTGKATSSSSSYEKDEKDLRKTEQEIDQLQGLLQRINFSEDHVVELQERNKQLISSIRQLRGSVENFEASRPYTAFRYRDPYTNFNRSAVKGIVCKLFNYIDEKYATALETAAGGKLYNVVVDTDQTSKSLLQRGNLQVRTTFIPLNKISSNQIDQNTIQLAQKLVGAENCQSALSLIKYDRSISPAMAYVFGNVFVCKDINVAKRIAFHDRIRRRCVTWDGDSVDPSGVLSGGAREKSESILKLLQAFQQQENELNVKEKEHSVLLLELRKLSCAQEEFNALKNKLEISEHQKNLINQRLLNTTFAREREELESLKNQIVELQKKAKQCRDLEAQCNAKAKDFENKMRDATGYRQNRLKESEAEMKRAKIQADKSKKKWIQHEQEYETLKLEIEELKKSTIATKEQLEVTYQTIEKLKQDNATTEQASSEITNVVKDLQSTVKQLKDNINKQNKEISDKIKKKEKLATEITEIQLEIKKESHHIKDLKTAYNISRSAERQYYEKIENQPGHLEKAEEMTPNDGENLERKIKIMQEKKFKLGRTCNAKAQSMFELEEKKFEEILKKKKIIEIDRKKLCELIDDLDKKKEQTMKIAHEQVSTSFGSIFSTLLPGAQAKLVSLPGKNVLQGVEIKVALGNVWKENLNELSGGQRSLAALSLILAMLLFKPAPVYILDEVDSALDLSHTQNIGNMLKKHFKKSQFIIVSLKDGMFKNANVLFQTTFMDGVSIVNRTENIVKNH